VAVQKRFGNTIKHAAKREHALKSCIFGVENPSNPQFKVEHTLQSAVPHIPSVSVLLVKAC
jgi:hypothetical protein